MLLVSVIDGEDELVRKAPLDVALAALQTEIRRRLAIVARADESAEVSLALTIRVH